MNGKTKDLTGQKFGEIEVISFAEYRKDRNKEKQRAYYLCKCSCGTEKIVLGTALEAGDCKSCGNKRRHLQNKPKNDLTGKKIGNLTVLSFVGFKEKTYSDRLKRYAEYECLCDCGNKVVLSNTIGKQKTCGCAKEEYYQKLVADSTFKYGDGNYELACWKRYYNQYNDSAKRRNIIFELDLEFFTQLCSKDCNYCGLSPTNEPIKRKHGKTIVVSGIDRVDNSIGYIKGNCVPCCKPCNFAKFKMTTEEWNIWLDRITNFRKNNERTCRSTVI